MSTVIDVAIGVAFLYLLLSLVVTTAQEAIASALHWRARNLYDSIADMLEDPETARRFFEHGLVRNLTAEKLTLNDEGKPVWNGRGLPSYIPSRTFALALLDVLRQKSGLTDASGATQLLSGAHELVDKVSEPRLKEQLRLLLADASELGSKVDVKAAIISSRIEGWFNDRMARTSGWYKRKAQLFSLVFAGAVALFGNADTLHVVSRLWRDSALRDTVAVAAQAFHENQSNAATVDAEPSGVGSTPSAKNDSANNTRGDSTTKTLEANFQNHLAEIANSGLPIGWSWGRDGWRIWGTNGLCARPLSEGTCKNPDGAEILLLVVGWLITALAVSLGAAFWFDMLGKVLQLRGTGPRLDPEAATDVSVRRTAPENDEAVVSTQVRRAV